MEDKVKILAQDTARAAKAKAENEPCDCSPGTSCATCNGVGTSVMTGTYIGDVEGQHGVCAKCAGTGWKGGAERLQKLRDDELQRSLKNDAITRDQEVVQSPGRARTIR